MVEARLHVNLVRESATAFSWALRVFWQFFRVRPLTTLGLLISLLGERITTLLAFFLPLKVIILAGSDGIPRYFRFFIQDEHRMEWIIGLSIAAVVFFILSFVFAAISRRFSAAGSMEVLQGANEIAVTTAQREDAQSYYSDFSQIVSGMLLALLAFVVLYFIDHRVFFAIAGLVFLEYGATFMFLRLGDVLNPRGILKIILRNLGGYLGFFSNVNFLAGFLVILIPYVFFEYDGNILFAILAILLMRQGMGAVSRSITLTTDLWHKRLAVDPMVFRDVTAKRREKNVSRDLRVLFEKTRREDVLEREIPKISGGDARITSEFRDVGFPQFYTFSVSIQLQDSNDIQHLQDQVFSARQSNLLERETFLFQHINRRDVHAPLVLGLYEDGPFKCQLVEAGFGKPVSRKEWGATLHAIVQRLWAFALPIGLINAFKSGNVTLSGRLSEDHIKRVKVSLDTSKQTEVFNAFLQHFETICDLVSTVPLYLHNNDMAKPACVFDFGDEGFRIMYWQRWTIDHIGTFLPPKLDGDALEEMLSAVREKRRLSEDTLTVAHVRLVSRFKELEGLIMREQFNGALRLMAEILKNPLVANHAP